MPQLVDVALWWEREGTVPGVLLAEGGAPEGRDAVHKAISSWPGWRRMPRAVRLQDGSLGSRYAARPWASSLLGMDPGSLLQLRWTPAAARTRDTLLKRNEDARRVLVTPGKELGLPSLWNGAPGERAPYPHQLQAIHSIRHRHYRALLADDMGLGKTSTALWAVHDWCLRDEVEFGRAGEPRRLLVVCPVGVKHNWRREIETALGPAWKVHVIGGTPAQRSTQFVELEFDLAREPKVAAIINYDLLRHLSDSQLTRLEDLATGGAAILDESHAVKNRHAERTQLVERILASDFRLLLTGTPIRNQPDDLYSQIELLHPETWTSYADYEQRYLHVAIIEVGTGRRTRKKKRVVGGKNLDKLNAIVQTLQIRRKKEDVLDLPPKTRTYPELDMDSVTRSLYRTMKDFAIVQLNEIQQELGEQVSIFNPAARSALEVVMRCEQIAQGFVGGIPEPIVDQVSQTVLKAGEAIPGRDRELIFPQSPKIAWLTETVRDLLAQGAHPVVFARFNAPLIWLVHDLERDGIRVSFLHGGLTDKGKDDAVQSFQQGATEVFVAQVKMAEGFNLVRSQDVIFLGRDWSPAVNHQAEDRCYRIGQKGTVNIQIPIVLETIEILVHKRLQAKHANAEQALRDVTLQDLIGAL